ncbi:hypothetical protein GCM10009539_51840 [Cryptosporangium japonicum]|uniref:Uncharacterized protein n=1 Tax=Cryptosporangium japonicum TaxID=80872 RepID=A0ABP3EFJ5_9ACTN
MFGNADGAAAVAGVAVSVTSADAATASAATTRVIPRMCAPSVELTRPSVAARAGSDIGRHPYEGAAATTG